MSVKRPIPVKTIVLSVLSLLTFILSVSSQNDIVDFGSDRWDLKNGEIVEYLDRTCLSGYVVLKDVVFENGVIEVDIAVKDNKVRGYPGIIFRMQSPGNYERFYIRPHRASLYPDALQYMPVFNGVECWQLYNGDGYTANADLPAQQWVHVKMEISGTQARIFLDNAEQPSLVISRLKHGASKGTLGLMGQRGGNAYFSNFKYTIDNELHFDPPLEEHTPLGMITEWELSQGFKASEVDLERPPEDQGFRDLTWQRVRCEPSGLVNVARYVGRSGRAPDCVWARTTIHSDKDEIREYQFGYSDVIVIFLNKKLIFSGNSAYTSRDPSFLGIVGLNDGVYLPLRKGDNELLLMIWESFGGWGFMFRDADAIFQHEGITSLWEYKKGLKYPESAVYDEKRDVLYVSNYFNDGDEFLSKVTLSGEMKDLRWITGLDRPTGLCLYEDKLYAVERGNLVEIDIDRGHIVHRYAVPEPVFINDVAFDDSGNAYISDVQKNVIYKFAGGEFELWLQHDEIQSPNGLCIDNNVLLVGNTGDGCLKAVDLSDKSIRTVVSLGNGSVMDGVKMYASGKYVISDFNGRVFLVSLDGQKMELLNITGPKQYCADLEFIRDENMLIIPTMYDNRLMTYKIQMEW
ncbi:MAG: SMP-30/gluconolactonase/LRE family protein [Gemmatimonadota bacterium]|nr:MAG: SMP-30/gluconolactonase/LRE family protein [Gemmatimonadota bacterium]